LLQNVTADMNLYYISILQNVTADMNLYYISIHIFVLFLFRNVIQ